VHDDAVEKDDEQRDRDGEARAEEVVDEVGGKQVNHQLGQMPPLIEILHPERDDRVHLDPAGLEDEVRRDHVQNAQHDDQRADKGCEIAQRHRSVAYLLHCSLRVTAAPFSAGPDRSGRRTW